MKTLPPGLRRLRDIGHNELRLFLRSRGSYIWLFAMPLAFMGLMSLARYGPDKPQNRFPPVLIENHDTGHVGAYFVEVLKTNGLWILDPAKDKRNQPSCGIRIPADFTARLQARQDAKVEFFPIAGANPADGQLIEGRVVRALVQLNSDLLEASAAPGEAGVPSAATLEALRKKPDPVKLDARYAGRDPVPVGFNYSLPGNLVNFLMMNLLLFGGITVATHRRTGTLRRLATLPVRRGELVAGEIYGLWLLGIVQVIFFLLVGRFLFHVNLGANLPGVILVLVVFAWLAAALGVLVGCVLGAPDRVMGVCIFASLIMAAVGGCWFPIEVTPDWMKIVAHTVPTGWAMEALNHLISFGHGLDRVVVPVLVLVGFGAVANLAAAKFFRV